MTVTKRILNALLAAGASSAQVGARDQDELEREVGKFGIVTGSGSGVGFQLRLE